MPDHSCARCCKLSSSTDRCALHTSSSLLLVNTGGKQPLLCNPTWLHLVSLFAAQTEGGTIGLAPNPGARNRCRSLNTAQRHACHLPAGASIAYVLFTCAALVTSLVAFTQTDHDAMQHGRFFYRNRSGKGPCYTETGQTRGSVLSQQVRAVAVFYCSGSGKGP